MAEDASPSSVSIFQGSNGKGRNAPSIPLNNYVKVRSQKPSNGLSIAGIALGVVVPFSLLFTVEDTLDVIPFCGLFILIGSVLILIGVSRYSKWDKHMKSARERIESEEDIPYPPIPQWPSIAATTSLVGGFVLSDLEGIFFLLGGIIGLIFLGIQAYQLRNRNQAYDALINEMV
ncbi:MAG: hypothetical protein VX115_00230 [Candidatus Thermoplasmatota archaeon]|nr:hypothetical protein [Candidatus Thermoplasmatota archaeon]